MVNGVSKSAKCFLDGFSIANLDLDGHLHASLRLTLCQFSLTVSANRVLADEMSAV